MPLGVVDTITSSLRRSVTSGTGITVVAPPERKKSTWLGGSVLASLSTFPEFCKSRRDYQEHGVSYFDSFCDGEILDKHVDT
ncbi:ACT-like protein [Mya arenaria]|uniref:ACT-like protein n=2 Tax=Mya arenaria TaxID=6604 RepID=A0ABY7EXQ5_MYAAR|nr:ACT-like protein [Mya arenaria]